jgi:hypothetical protein
LALYKHSSDQASTPGHVAIIVCALSPFMLSVCLCKAVS